MEEIVAQIVNLVLAHKWEAALLVFLSSGTFAHVLVLLLNRIPLAGWFAVVRGAFRLLSIWGDKRFTRFVWSPWETFLIRLALGTADAVKEGLLSDDLPGSPGTAPTPPASDPRALAAPPGASGPARCGLCGFPMPPGEEMFQYHGQSGPCPIPPAGAQPAPGA